MNRGTPNIGIVGGGIGGMAAAVALSRSGLPVTVYEQSDSLREAGAGLMLWPNGSRVVRELGLLKQVVAHSGANTHFVIRSTSGDALMDLPLGGFDAPARCIRRSDLLEILLAEFPASRVRLSRRVISLDQAPGRVRLRFLDGSEAEHDAVIGADGSRSRVRASLWGDLPLVYRGYTIWRGLARCDRLAIEGVSNGETWGRGRRFGLLDTGGGRFTWYATANVPAGHPDEPAGRKRGLREWFAGWHAPIPEIIERTEETAILRNGAYDLPPLRAWGRGRVTLLGDAAHPCTPNLGQGGCMALEDALTLAKCLRQTADVADALRDYEALRRGRSHRIQQRSRLLGGIGQIEDDLLVAARHWLTRMLPSRWLERSLAPIYAHQI